MIVIGLIGSKGSGKETAAGYIVKRYGGRKHSHSEILADILSVLGISHTRMNLIALVKLREVFGDNVLINALNSRIKKEDADIVAVTGIRFQNELDNIRSYPNNFVIFIDATIEQRYKNQQTRSQYTDDKTMSFDEFFKIEQTETERHVYELKDKADAIIENNGTIHELEEKLDQVLKPLIKK